MDPHNRIQLLQGGSIEIFKRAKLWLTELYTTANVFDSGIKPGETQLIRGSNVAQSRKQMKPNDGWLEKHYRKVFNAAQLAPPEKEKFQSIINCLTELKDEDTYKNAIQYCDDIRSTELSKKFEQIVKYCVAGIFQLGGNEKESLSLRETIASQNKNAPILNATQVADNLHQLGWLQFRLDKLTDAVLTFKDALNLKCIVYGMVDYLTLNTYKSLGQVIEKQGNTEEAYSIYRDALNIEKKLLREKSMSLEVGMITPN